MKPDYGAISPADLKAYVLQNREDDEAIRAYFHRPGVDWVTMPPMFDEAGNPIEQNIKFAEETFRQRLDRERSE